MPRIAVLNSTVVDQIAAGEVVERPASVVKELVENSLDARASSIEISVDDGGRSRIRVADDGMGMDRSDALLALERHATSKIAAAQDLVGVSSFGFRGEALPAIASVSHLDLETAAADGEGTIVRAVGGEIEAVREAARRRGTTVTVSRLFFNTPARKKFLRSARSEWRGIRDLGIGRGAEAAYRSTIPSGTRPTLFLELTVPADVVDVNVHPSKAEVRFRDRWSVERAVENAVRRALGDTSSAAAIGRRGWPMSLSVGAAPTVDVEVLHRPLPSVDGAPL